MPAAIERTIAEKETEEVTTVSAKVDVQHAEVLDKTSNMELTTEKTTADENTADVEKEDGASVNNGNSDDIRKRNTEQKLVYDNQSYKKKSSHVGTSCSACSEEIQKDEDVFVCQNCKNDHTLCNSCMQGSEE